MKEKFALLCSYLIEFTACAFCGWLYEVLLQFAVYHNYMDRGLLPLPLCPIYGFGGMALLLLFRRRNDWWLVFLGSTLLTTVLELAAFLLLERFGLILWDYSAWPLNYKGMISVPSSLIFGLLALALVKGVHPLGRLLYRKAPEWLICVLGCGFLLLMGGGLVWVIVRS